MDFPVAGRREGSEQGGVADRHIWSRAPPTQGTWQWRAEAGPSHLSAVQSFLEFALITFTSVLFIVDPIAVIPSYLVVTRTELPDQRARTAKRACVAAALILAAFALGGTLIFKLFGITLPAFRIAGGLILWLVAMDMLHAERRTQESTPEIMEGETKEDTALTPLAMPTLAGPGAISTVMVLALTAKSPATTAAVYGSVVLTSLLSYFVLSAATLVERRLGQTGMRILTRLMGLVLSAIAIQFIIDGIKLSFVPTS